MDMDGSDATHQGLNQLLLDLVSRPDERLWLRLVSSQIRVVLRVVAPIVGNPSLADEVAQDAMMAIYVALPRYRQACDDPAGADLAAQSWIIRIASNLACNRIRDLRRRWQRSAPIEQVAERDATPAEDDGRQRLALVELRRALADLPESDRLPVVLRFIQGWDYDRIAEALDCRLEAARQRVSRGLGRLRRRLGPATMAALALWSQADGAESAAADSLVHRILDRGLPRTSAPARGAMAAAGIALGLLVVGGGMWWFGDRTAPTDTPAPAPPPQPLHQQAVTSTTPASVTQILHDGLCPAGAATLTLPPPPASGHRTIRLTLQLPHAPIRSARNHSWNVEGSRTPLRRDLPPERPTSPATTTATVRLLAAGRPVTWILDWRETGSDSDGSPLIEQTLIYDGSEAAWGMGARWPTQFHYDFPTPMLLTLTITDDAAGPQADF
jgi:RNA polymerase sigma-70 factor (ECF subfamily)